MEVVVGQGGYVCKTQMLIFEQENSQEIDSFVKS